MIEDEKVKRRTKTAQNTFFMSPNLLSAIFSIRAGDPLDMAVYFK
jgi:hypothetical protein